MTHLIERDHRRFRKIVQGHVKRNLRKYLSNRELIGRRGKRLVSLPIPEIELPRFRFGNPRGGVGQGEGEQGQPVGAGDPQGQAGSAGDQPGAHILEAELTIQELADILGDELELPHIQPKGKQNFYGEVTRYSGLRRAGPESLRHFKRTFRQALKRQVAAGTYNPEKPVIIPVREDKRYRSWRVLPMPENNAVIFYMMDVSGSMTLSKKELVRMTAFWIDTWLRAHYQNLVIRYLVHDAAAAEVDGDTFYHLRESGGTRISSVYELCARLIKEEYDPTQWNLYGFHFSDGENFGSEDDDRSRELLEQVLLPSLNLFCYGQVKGSGSKQFIHTLEKIEDEKLSAARIEKDDDIYDAIKAFLGKGL